MNIAIIVDAFPPLRTSCAVQMRDLALEMSSQGHKVTVITTDSTLKVPYVTENMAGVQVLRVRMPATDNVGNTKRVLLEALRPFFMKHYFKKSALNDVGFDGIIWYSPSIFLAPFVKYLKKTSGCRSYLILRDIFPEWAVDLSLLSRGIPYKLFKIVEKYQYNQADAIGYQANSAHNYLENTVKKPENNFELLHNWLSVAPNNGCDFDISTSVLKGRKIFVYAGNIGVAQNVDIFIDLAKELITDQNIGFLFVGRGSEVERLKNKVISDQIDNVLFVDEIEPEQIPGLLEQCHFGVLSLDLRLKSDNVPGKFLTYMQAGLPVLARVNKGNDLIKLINSNELGQVSVSTSVEVMVGLTKQLLSDPVSYEKSRKACKKVSKEIFATHAAVDKIIQFLDNDSN